MATEDDLPTLDPQFVLRHLGGTLDDFLAVAEVFVEELPNLHWQIRSLASSSSGVEAAAAVLHELANSFGVIGARRAAAQARSLEAGLRDASQSVPDMDQVAASMAAELVAVEHALRQYLARPGR